MRILIGLGLAGLLGVGIFGTLAWRATSLRSAQPPAAAMAFKEVTLRFHEAPPSIILDAEGRPMRNPATPDPTRGGVNRLVVMAYRADSQKLVTTEVPFWFFRLKGSAARFAFRDTGFDLDRLSLRPKDVAAQGPGIIFSQKTIGGDQVLVWAE